MKKNMMLRIKRVLTNNVGLKLMAIVFAIALWLIVVNVDDPMQTKTFTASVNISNEEVLTNEGKYYEIADGGRTVNFRVSARRSTLERLSSEDFVATADMNYLDETGKIPVAISYTGNFSNVTISAKKLYLQLSIGEEMTVKHQIEIETTGNPSDECVVSNSLPNVEAVSITGPVEVVQQIQRVVAYVDVEGAATDVTADSILHFLDGNGNEVDQSKLRVDVENVQVHVTILRAKQVDVEFSTKGKLAEGLYLDDISVNPSQVEIVGVSEAINEVSSIEIPASVVDLSEIKDNKTIAVDLYAYLPEGISFREGFDGKVEIQVKVSGERTKTYRIPTANFTVQNLSEDLSANFTEETVKVQITGSKEALSKLSEKNITGTIDVSGLTEGEHKVDVKLNLEKENQFDTVTVSVEIK